MEIFHFENYIVSPQIEEANRKLVESIRGKILPMPSLWRCIYKIPTRFRKVEEDEFLPQMVSIGPFHHGKETLQVMEEQKRWYTYALLARNSTLETTLEESVTRIRSMEVGLRGCYGEPIKLNSDEFVEMMLFDGCFIIELFHCFRKEVRIGEDDPIFNTNWIITSLQHDLILLENQLPYIVLEYLFNLTKNPRGGIPLNELAIHFFNPMFPTLHPIPIKHNVDVKHLLDLLRKHLLPSSQQMEDENYQSGKETDTYCATEIHEAGVKFKKKDDANDLFDITFSEDGVLEIPPYFFNRDVFALLRNIMSLEQYDSKYTGEITSFVIFMFLLINTKEDVKLLKHEGIMSASRNYEEVALDISKLTKGAYNTKFRYKAVCHHINKYCRTDWHIWRATLKRNYFNTPWAYLSFAAALVLLILTFLQALYSILSYNHDKKK